MSRLEATIINIDNVDSLNIVSFSFGDSELKMMSLELDDSMSVGTKVLLSIKPTSVALAKNLNGVLSYLNQITSQVEHIEEGKLLSNIKLLACGNLFESIITTSSLKGMNLAIGDKVTALIKANEISIAEVLK